MPPELPDGNDPPPSATADQEIQPALPINRKSVTAVSMARPRPSDRARLYLPGVDGRPPLSMSGSLWTPRIKCFQKMPTGIGEATLRLVVGQQQRANPWSAAPRIGPAHDDDELFPVETLGLEPQATIARPVRRINLLGDDAEREAILSVNSAMMKALKAPNERQ